MRRGPAILVAIAPVLSFGIGAWVEDGRMRDHYISEGRTSATYDAIFDGYWLYFQCLSDDCAHEKRASDYIVRRGEERLNNGGVYIPNHLQAKAPETD